MRSISACVLNKLCTARDGVCLKMTVFWSQSSREGFQYNQAEVNRIFHRLLLSIPIHLIPLNDFAIVSATFASFRHSYLLKCLLFSLLFSQTASLMLRRRQTSIRGSQMRQNLNLLKIVRSAYEIPTMQSSAIFENIRRILSKQLNNRVTNAEYLELHFSKYRRIRRETRMRRKKRERGRGIGSI